MARKPGQNPISFNYEVNFNAPLDGRTHLKSKDDLIAYSAGNLLYDGFIVTIGESGNTGSTWNGVWQLIDSSTYPLTFAKWRKLGGGEGTQGPAGNTGETGPSPISATTIGGILYFNYATGPSINAGPLPKGSTGNTGPTGPFVNAYNSFFSGVTTITITHGHGVYPVVQVLEDTGSSVEKIIPDSIIHGSTDSFTVNFSVGTSGWILIGGGGSGEGSGTQGPQGEKGETGAGVTGATIVNGNLYFYAGGASFLAGPIPAGPKGNTGETGPAGDGLGGSMVTGATIWATIDAGWIQAGDPVPQGSSLEDFIRQLLVKIQYPTVAPNEMGTYSVSTSTIATNVVKVSTVYSNFNIIGSFSRGAIRGATDSANNNIWIKNNIQMPYLGAPTSYVFNNNAGGQKTVLAPASTTAFTNITINLGNNNFNSTVNYAKGATPLDSTNTEYITALPIPAAAGSKTSALTIEGALPWFATTQTTGIPSIPLEQAIMSNLNPTTIFFTLAAEENTANRQRFSIPQYQTLNLNKKIATISEFQNNQWVPLSVNSITREIQNYIRTTEPRNINGTTYQYDLYTRTGIIVGPVYTRITWA